MDAEGPLEAVFFVFRLLFEDGEADSRFGEAMGDAKADDPAAYNKDVGTFGGSGGGVLSMSWLLFRALLGFLFYRKISRSHGL